MLKKPKWWAVYRNFWQFAKARFSESFLNKPWSVQHDKALYEVLRAIFCVQLLYIGSYMLGSAWGSFLHEKHIHQQESEKQEIAIREHEFVARKHELTSQLDSLQVVLLKEQAVLLRSSGSGVVQLQSSLDNAGF